MVGFIYRSGCDRWVIFFLSIFFPHCDFHSRWCTVVFFFYLDLAMFVLSVPRIRLSTETQPKSKWWAQWLWGGAIIPKLFKVRFFLKTAYKLCFHLPKLCICICLQIHLRLNIFTNTRVKLFHFKLIFQYSPPFTTISRVFIYSYTLLCCYVSSAFLSDHNGSLY